MFSEPVTGEKFFGREEVLELLKKRALALKDGYRQNVALTGQSLAGKTSIILHFLHMIKEEGFVPVYVEAVREPFRSFANKFIATLLYNFFQKAGENIEAEMPALLDKAREMLPKTGAAIKQVNSFIERGELDEAYSKLLELTSVLKEETGAPCIVILDEFDNLEHLGIKNPFLSFGKVIMVQKDTMYIVSSSRSAAIKKIISEKLSLLFGNFEVVKISNFGLNASREFINTRLANFEVDDDLKKFLISFTDGNPFYLGRIAAEIKNKALERMSSFIDKDMARDSILELVYSSDGSIHQYLLNFILDLLDSRSRESYISMLVAIASGHNKQQEIGRATKAKKSELSKSLLRLMELGLISKNGIFYYLDDAMLEFWLKHVYQRRRDLLVDGTFDRTALFSKEFEVYMSGVMADSSKGVTMRIAELFNCFSNELVEIESKQMRLPNFTRVEEKAFRDSKQFIAASYRGNFWIAQPYTYNINENDIIDYIRNTKSLGCKITNKVIMPLKGIDENAKLLAKELKISIWTSATVNTLLGFYSKPRMVIL